VEQRKCKVNRQFEFDSLSERTLSGNLVNGFKNNNKIVRKVEVLKMNSCIKDQSFSSHVNTLFF
jgi:hypothetical protein